MSDDGIHLREITADNWRECVAMRISGEQARYVRSNAYSLAESHFVQDRIPLAVYEGQRLVGMCVCSFDQTRGRAWIHRLTIDADVPYERVGRSAVQTLLDRMRQLPGVRVVGARMREGNRQLRMLYEGLGFRQGRENPEGEVVLWYDIDRGGNGHGS